MNKNIDLEDILDKIVADDSDYINEPEDFIETLLHTMELYIRENPKEVSDPDFEEEFEENIRDLVNIQLEDHLTFYNEEEFDDFLEEAFELFYETIMPQRSLPDSIIINEPNIKLLEDKINWLRSLPQPEQRTTEWYICRRNLITASNAYKAFENASSRNQLIYEKCQPLNIQQTNNFINVDSPLHWGQKYEPVSVMIYEDMYGTKIEDFGCIQHQKYKFLGASPDGINIDKNNPRFGRMLEIKNIKNREIDGIPKKEYWIQMQLQMETCDLDECDFLETKFLEYENEEEFKNDYESEYKGIILYFSDKGRPIYKYCPIHLYKNEEEYILWEETMMDLHSDKTWIKTIYWKAEIISCVLVQRNKMWFNNSISELENIWKIIEKERVDGYEHRSPNKRVKKEESCNQVSGSVCLININKVSGKSECTSPIQVVKIRTESFDETKKQLNNL